MEKGLWSPGRHGKLTEEQMHELLRLEAGWRSAVGISSGSFTKFEYMDWASDVQTTLNSKGLSWGSGEARKLAGSDWEPNAEDDKQRARGTSRQVKPGASCTERAGVFPKPFSQNLTSAKQDWPLRPRQSLARVKIGVQDIGQEPMDQEEQTVLQVLPDCNDTQTKASSPLPLSEVQRRSEELPGDEACGGAQCNLPSKPSAAVSQELARPRNMTARHGPRAAGELSLGPVFQALPRRHLTGAGVVDQPAGHQHPAHETQASLGAEESWHQAVPSPHSRGSEQARDIVPGSASARPISASSQVREPLAKSESTDSTTHSSPSHVDLAIHSLAGSRKLLQPRSTEHRARAADTLPRCSLGSRALRTHSSHVTTPLESDVPHRKRSQIYSPSPSRKESNFYTSVGRIQSSRPTQGSSAYRVAQVRLYQLDIARPGDDRGKEIGPTAELSQGVSAADGQGSETPSSPELCEQQQSGVLSPWSLNMQWQIASTYFVLPSPALHGPQAAVTSTGADLSPQRRSMLLTSHKPPLSASSAGLHEASPTLREQPRPSTCHPQRRKSPVTVALPGDLVALTSYYKNARSLSPSKFDRLSRTPPRRDTDVSRRVTVLGGSQARHARKPTSLMENKVAAWERMVPAAAAGMNHFRFCSDKAQGMVIPPFPACPRRLPTSSPSASPSTTSTDGRLAQGIEVQNNSGRVGVQRQSNHTKRMQFSSVLKTPNNHSHSRQGVGTWKSSSARR